MLILPREELRSKITENPKKHNAIIIGASELELLGLSSFCKESLVAMFKDIVNPDKENAPTLDKKIAYCDIGSDQYCFSFRIDIPKRETIGGGRSKFQDWHRQSFV